GAAQGVLARNFAFLDDGMGAFRTEMGASWSNTAVIIATEFGRTAAPNGAGGTDHGTATAAFLAGGAVQGGRGLADWPGWRGAAPYQTGHLRRTADLRALIKGVLSDHMRVPRVSLERDVFPESALVSPLQGLLRS